MPQSSYGCLKGQRTKAVGPARAARGDHDGRGALEREDRGPDEGEGGPDGAEAVADVVSRAVLRHAPRRVGPDDDERRGDEHVPERLGRNRGLQCHLHV